MSVSYSPPLVGGTLSLFPLPWWVGALRTRVRVRDSAPGELVSRAGANGEGDRRLTVSEQRSEKSLCSLPSLEIPLFVRDDNLCETGLKIQDWGGEG